MSEESKPGFDSEKYLKAQKAAFDRVLSRDQNNPAFVEFGGKSFQDRHTERVLPGYDTEAKAEILREVVKFAEAIVVVNALDILARPD